jgi:hypothetical protein
MNERYGFNNEDEPEPYDGYEDIPEDYDEDTQESDTDNTTPTIHWDGLRTAQVIPRYVVAGATANHWSVGIALGFRRDLEGRSTSPVWTSRIGDEQMSSVMEDFTYEIRRLITRNGMARTPATKNEMIIGYLEHFFETNMDDALVDKVLARIDDLRESSGGVEWEYYSSWTLPHHFWW